MVSQVTVTTLEELRAIGEQMRAACRKHPVDDSPKEYYSKTVEEALAKDSNFVLGEWMHKEGMARAVQLAIPNLGIHLLSVSMSYDTYDGPPRYHVSFGGVRYGQIQMYKLPEAEAKAVADALLGGESRQMPDEGPHTVSHHERTA